MFIGYGCTPLYTGPYGIGGNNIDSEGKEFWQSYFNFLVKASMAVTSNVIYHRHRSKKSIFMCAIFADLQIILFPLVAKNVCA